MMPLLIVLAGGLLAEGVPAPARNRATASKVAAVVAVLAFLWWVDLPEVLLDVLAKH